MKTSAKTKKGVACHDRDLPIDSSLVLVATLQGLKHTNLSSGFQRVERNSRSRSIEALDRLCEYSGRSGYVVLALEKGFRMNKLAMSLLSAGMLVGALQTASSADETADASRGAEASMNNLRKVDCDRGDHVVLLNTKTNQYTMVGARTSGDAAGTQTAGSRTDVNKGSMARESGQEQGGAKADTASSASDYRRVCKSKADAMGAKMVVKSGSLLNSKVGTGGSH